MDFQLDNQLTEHHSVSESWAHQSENQLMVHQVVLVSLAHPSAIQLTEQ
jgi:hypothetical protein